jgi:hypothetical protein
VKLFQAGRTRAENESPRRSSRSRRATAAACTIAALGIGTAVAGALPASAEAASQPAAHFAAAATPFQNKVIEKVMERLPGGTRVSSGDVRWRDGVTVAIPTSATARPAFDGTAKSDAATGLTSNCANSDFCAFDQKGFMGCSVSIPQTFTNRFADWALFSGTNCGGNGTWSWANETPFKVWKAQGHSGGTQVDTFDVQGGSNTGTVWCIPAEVQNSDVGDKATRTLGWIQMTASTGACDNS